LPTPTAADGERSSEEYPGGNPTLLGSAKRWPTPTAQDGKNSKLPPSQRERDTLPGAMIRRMWPTPAATDGTRGGEMTENMTGQSLPQMVNSVEKWPTPQESDATRGPDYARSSRESSGGDDCTTAVCKEEGKSGNLNPAWVAWLMGFPTGWTALED